MNVSSILRNTVLSFCYTLHGCHAVFREETGSSGYSVISIYLTPARNKASLSDSVIHLAGESSLYSEQTDIRNILLDCFRIIT